MEVIKHELLENAKLELLICRLSLGGGVPGKISKAGEQIRDHIMKTLMYHIKEFRF